MIIVPLEVLWPVYFDIYDRTEHGAWRSWIEHHGGKVLTDDRNIPDSILFNEEDFVVFKLKYEFNCSLNANDKT